jgi:uncharacterized protein
VPQRQDPRSGERGYRIELWRCALNQHPSHVNRLIDEASPYLKQHAHNPVDWYPWGREALEAARRLDRPIFLSIGYSACHWCHVMERESFENAEVARLLNENFVPIKVDREERPDLDQIYMTAVQILTGQGGWPMSVFLTPELKPFYGGTYFPPDDRYGRPSFKRVLSAVDDAWRTKRDEIVHSSDEITQHLNVVSQTQADPGELGPDLIRKAVVVLGHSFDPTFGGFGSAPKFPQATELRLLLRAWKRFDDEGALQMARLTLDRMAMGGMNDQLGGGFHRYSTDQRWLVPHFEKMLYDNALLSLAYLEAYQATGEPLYREVVEETLGYVQREMTSPEGAFYSSQDADSEGEEGKFFVWSAEEIEEALGSEAADLFEDVYGVSADGNWEGGNILHRTKTYPQQAALRHLEVATLRRLLDEARRKLLEVRSGRTRPMRDEKVLTSWNALMIDSFAQASQALQQPAYARAAAGAADFILKRMRSPQGRLWRSWSAGVEPKINAYLDDYAFFINSLVSLYETTFEPRWLEEAIQLARVMIDQFWDSREGGFFYTGRDHEVLIARTKDSHDGSVPSGNSLAAFGLLRLSKLTDQGDLRETAEKTLRHFRGLMERTPQAAAQVLIGLDFYLGPVLEFAVVGNRESDELRNVLHVVRSGFLPNKVVALKAAGEDQPHVEELIPLLAGKKALAPVTTYICQNYACQAPLLDERALEMALKSPDQLKSLLGAT